MNMLNELVGYKSNVQNSFVFLYTSKQQPGNKIKTTISLTIASKQ